MLTTFNKLTTGLYVNQKGVVVDVIGFVQNADDCKQYLVLFSTIAQTDFPPGTTWIKPVTSFELKFNKV